jgi:DNA-binding LacI/PurR family transcriptional regulator
LDEEFFTSVSLDTKQAAYDAVHYFTSKGHTRIGIIGPSGQENLGSACLDGYRQALKDAKLEARLQWEATANQDYQGGYRAMFAMLDSGKYPSAVYCTNDDIACGAIRAVEKSGLRVPEDISFIGSGNSPISEWNRPSITTIGLDHIHFGNELARVLFEELDSEGHAPVASIKVDHKIIERESVKSF